ncbi:MAG: Mrp/NBP35 family ATP-binding protein [Clostridia bacterium]|nr:Mrp/NBP35 family ATP-binding protein [Clostridia bacterium]
MSSNCSGNCSSCKENCSDRDLHLPQNQYSDIKKVIGVVSGKCGVGKSLVTSLLAASVSSKGKSTAVLDADITGPSIPKSFGVHGLAESNAMGLIPKETATLGIKIMSINLLLEKEESPVVWRGPVISGVLQQFWTDVAWGDVDYMFIDMPPGTGDVPLTVFQTMPLDGIVIVTTPQDLVHMIVKKAYNMAQQMNIPVLGIIENMSGFVCPDCGKTYEIFGKSKVDEIAKELNIPVLAKLPIRSNITALVDKGAVELAEVPEIEEAAEAILKL